MTSRCMANLLWVVAPILAIPTTAGALQDTARPLLQLEVRDESGLPLPNARLELFSYAEGGMFREWLPIAPEVLGPGVYLLRFSHEGFHPVVFSVPLRKETPVSLRVRLGPESRGRLAGRPAEAVPVDAIGLALNTRAGTDVIGSRRVIDREEYERTNAQGVAELFRIASVRRSIGARETMGDGGIRLRNPRTGEVCNPSVMLNGDTTLPLSLARYQELYRLSEPEAIEFVLDGRAVPYTFRRGHDLDCPVVMIWLRGR